MTTSALPRELDAALDDLIHRFAEGQHQDDVVRARARYAERTGRVFEEDEIYEARTIAFLEWYIVEEPLGPAPPVALALADDDAEAPREAWRAWATSHRSLFLVEAMAEGAVTIHD